MKILAARGGKHILQVLGQTETGALFMGNVESVRNQFSGAWSYWLRWTPIRQQDVPVEPPPPVATLEAREAPDLAKELIAWLDLNVMRCGHGTIGVTCHLCANHLLR